MKVTYTPTDGDALTWDYFHGRVRQSEAEMCERRLDGIKWLAFEGEILQGSARARKVLLWHLLRRDHPALRWEDVPDFCMDELEVELTLADKRVLRDKLSRAPQTPDIREILATFDTEIAEAEASGEGGEGKAS